MLTRGLVFIAAIAAAPLSAQVTNPHDALVAELAAPDMFVSSFNRIIETDMPAVLRKDPNVAAIERVCPGTIDAVIAALAPTLAEFNDRGVAEYRVSLRELLGARLSAEDAAQAAEFFASDVGHRFLRTVGSQSGMRNSLESALDSGEGEIDRGAFQRDQQQAVRDGMAELSPADIRAINAAVSTSSWGKAFAGLSGEIVELRYRITNTKLTPEEELRFEKLSAEAMDAHLRTCGADDAE